MDFQILQCLSTQGLTSSSVGGGSAVSGEGGSGSGASRGLIKDRSISIYFLLETTLYSFHFHIHKLFWPGWRSVLCDQIQDFQYPIWGASPKTISVDCSWHWVARVTKTCCRWSLVACLQILYKTLWVCSAPLCLHHRYICFLIFL